MVQPGQTQGQLRCRQMDLRHLHHCVLRVSAIQMDQGNSGRPIWKRVGELSGTASRHHPEYAHYKEWPGMEEIPSLR
jgi:hypothetical protein